MRTGRPPQRSGCAVSGCDRAIYCRRLCNAHYLRLLAKGDVGSPTVRRKNGQGKGGRWLDGNGYVILSDGKRRQAEHRRVMEGVLGRSLFKGESVHHRNGVKTDNRPENLELWVSSQPAGQRVEDVLAWAREVVARYS